MTEVQMAKPYASYRRLLGNSKAALTAAIEICNKPNMDYREECFVILLVNAWELLLKAVLRKSRKTVFYPKRRHEPYRTLSISDAVERCRALLPPAVEPRAVLANLNQLVVLRDNAVHFYNQRDLTFLLFGLAQTAVKNFNDTLIAVFGQSLGDALPGTMLPLGLEPPVDAFLKRMKESGRRQSPAVAEFVRQMQEEVARLEEDDVDTSRFLTWYRVKLESTKKVEKADFTVGVSGTGETIVVERFRDPNTFPYREKEIVELKLSVGATIIGQAAFRAVVWKWKLKGDSRYCWVAREGVLIKYSSETVKLLRSLTEEGVLQARKEHREYLAKKRMFKKAVRAEQA
jgi:hypothetical protein